MSEFVQKTDVLYWTRDEDLRNFGDYFTELFLAKALLGPRVVASRYRLIGSIIDNLNLETDFSTVPAGGEIAYWGCGARDSAPLRPDLLARCRFFGVRGPLTRDLIGMPVSTVLGDPGLLLPAIVPIEANRTPHGEVLCAPHFYETRSDDDLIALTGAQRVLRPMVAPNLEALERLVQDIAGASFVLAGAMHAAIIAHAYKVPFAFFDAGHLDIPFKWRDFAASIDIQTMYVNNVSDGRTVFDKFIKDRAKRIALLPILENCPYYVRPSVLVRAAILDGRLAANAEAGAIEAFLKTSKVESSPYVTAHYESERRRGLRLSARIGELERASEAYQARSQDFESQVTQSHTAFETEAGRVSHLEHELDALLTQVRERTERLEALGADHQRLVEAQDRAERDLGEMIGKCEWSAAELERALAEGAALAEEVAAKSELIAVLEQEKRSLIADFERQSDHLAIRAAGEKQALAEQFEAEKLALAERFADQSRTLAADFEQQKSELAVELAQRNASLAELGAGNMRLVERWTSVEAQNIELKRRNEALAASVAASSMKAQTSMAAANAALAANKVLAENQARLDAEMSSGRIREREAMFLARLNRPDRNWSALLSWLAPLALFWRLRLARAAARARNWAGAERWYARMLRIEPNQPRILVRYGHALKEQGLPSLAAVAYARSMKLPGADADAQDHLVQALRLAGLNDEANAVFREAAADNALAPDDAALPAPVDVKRLPLWRWPARHAARVAARSGNWALATQRYQKLLRAAPEVPGLWVQLGHSLKERGDLKGARAAYARAIPLDPTAPDPYVQLGRVFKLMNMNEKAERAFNRAFQLAPANADARRELELMGRSDADLIALVAQVSGVAVAKPLSLAAVLQRRSARAAARRQDWGTAARLYQNLAAAWPNHWSIWLQLGHACKEGGDLDAATGAYLAAVVSQPDRSEPWLELGHLMKRRSRIDEAVTAFRHANRRNPDGADARREIEALGKPLVATEPVPALRPWPPTAPGVPAPAAPVAASVGQPSRAPTMAAESDQDLGRRLALSRRQVGLFKELKSANRAAVRA